MYCRAVFHRTDSGFSNLLAVYHIALCVKMATNVLFVYIKKLSIAEKLLIIWIIYRLMHEKQCDRCS